MMWLIWVLEAQKAVQGRYVNRHLKKSISQQWFYSLHIGFLLIASQVVFRKLNGRVKVNVRLKRYKEVEESYQIWRDSFIVEISVNFKLAIEKF